MIYLALYKGKARNWKKRLTDKLIRFSTNSQYSHCELAIKCYGERNLYECYSASLQDGGVRSKFIDLSDETKWVLIPVNNVGVKQIHSFYKQTSGKGYDFIGAIGVVLPIQHSKQRYFCSEWIAQCLGLENPETYSPEKLARMFKEK